MTDDQRLTERLADLVGDEPAFQAGLGQSLWAAEQGGRRRRARANAARASTVLLACAAAAAAAVVLLPGPGPRAVPPPAASTGAVIVTPSPAPATTTATPEAALRALVAAIAEPLDGDVKITSRDADGPGFAAQVTSAAGPLEISAGFAPPGAGSISAMQQGCVPQEVDGRTCRTLLIRKTIGIWDVVNTNVAGRRSLFAFADREGGGTLMVIVNNYVITPDGHKVVGPDWRKSGPAPAAVRAAIEASGLAVPERPVG